MNKTKLLNCEKEFLSTYPDGFESEDMKRIGKKHNIQKHVDYIHKVCSKKHLKAGLTSYSDVLKVITRSSMVSVFEKMRFRDACNDFDKHEKLEFLDAVYEIIHGDEKKGFNKLLSIFTPYKLAKWPILTAWKAYYYPHSDVFIKPTTVKKIIVYLELKDIVYSPKASYGFYKKYRRKMKEMKAVIKTESLKPHNPAFSGFLMMTIM